MACGALADGRLLSSLPAESPPYLTAVYVLIVADEFAEAERLLDLQLARARATGTVIGFTGGMVIRSILRLRTGALKDAEADARIAMNAMRAAMLLHVAAPPSMAVVVEALTLQGLLDDAEEALRANGMETLPATAQYARLLFSRGLLRLAQGRPAEALDDLMTAGPLEEPAGMLNPGAPWREHAAHALCLLDRGEEAAAMSEQWLALAAAWGGASVHAGALRTAARFGAPPGWSGWRLQPHCSSPPASGSSSRPRCASWARSCVARAVAARRRRRCAARATSRKRAERSRSSRGCARSWASPARGRWRGA